jgi:hypothetical protein
LRTSGTRGFERNFGLSVLSVLGRWFSQDWAPGSAPLAHPLSRHRPQNILQAFDAFPSEFDFKIAINRNGRSTQSCVSSG